MTAVTKATGQPAPFAARQAGRWLKGAAAFAALAALAAMASLTEITAGCRGSGLGERSAGGARPQRLTVRVLAVHPHDPQAFTQGLLWWRGRLYESTGIEGRSTLREVDLASGQVLRRRNLAAELFGEGLAAAGERLVQVTWNNGRALLWEGTTLESAGDLRYVGEGWGLTSDGERLWMSDGSEYLSVRDPTTFAELTRLRVTSAGEPLAYLNELEWVEGAIWANIWLSDEIVRIDLASGAVTAVVDASTLLPPDERRRADVLNGIAYDPERRVFFLTGKLWPKLFEVTFNP